MASLSYESTAVPVERSKEAIRQLLIKFGARGVQFTEEFNTGQINVRFAKEVNVNLRTVSITMQVPESPQPKKRRKGTWRGGRFIPSRGDEERRRQMERATYRALHYWLKSQFEAVQFGLLTFEDVFLSHFEWILDGRRTTVGAMVLPHLSNGSSFLPAPRDENVLEAG